jgi:hypothetical protein
MVLAKAKSRFSAKMREVGRPQFVKLRNSLISTLILSFSTTGISFYANRAAFPQLTRTGRVFASTGYGVV